MKIILFLAGGILLLYGCRKKEDAFEEITVNGRVWDDNRQQSITNLLVYLYDVKCENWACGFNEIVDSTRTDNNGYYKIIYKRKNSNSLYVNCGYPNRSYVHAQPQVQDQPIYKNNNTIDFTLRKTSVLKARIIVSGNPFPPLKVADNIEAYMVEITGTNKDTLIYLRGVPNQNNVIDLVIVEPGYQYGRYKKENIFIPSFADTSDVTIMAEANTFTRFRYY